MKSISPRRLVAIFGIVVISLFCELSSIAFAGSTRPATKSEWIYFNTYEPDDDCFPSDEAALQDRMATHEANPDRCIVVLEGWTSTWPNSEGITSFSPRCFSSQGGGYSHQESRSYQYKYQTLSTCGQHFFFSTGDIRRHFFYLCPAGYEAYLPLKNSAYYSPNIPACRSISDVVDPEKNLGCGNKCPSTSEGNPIDVATGNKFQREVDYVGASTFPLRLERYYNSMGSGWTFDYQQFIELVPINTEIVSARVHRPDGRVISFDNQTGLWRADTDIFYKLTSTTDTSGRSRVSSY